MSGNVSQGDIDWGIIIRSEAACKSHSTNYIARHQGAVRVQEILKRRWLVRIVLCWMVEVGCSVFFTPIHCTYTNSQLDGMARNYLLFFIYMDTQDHAIYRVWIHVNPTSVYPRREKTLGLSWNWTQVLLLHKQLLRTTRPWLLGRGSSGSLIGIHRLWRTWVCIPSKDRL